MNTNQKRAKYLIANNNKKCNKNKERKKKQLQFYELTNHHSVRLARCQRELCKWMEDFWTPINCDKRSQWIVLLSRSNHHLVFASNWFSKRFASIKIRPWNWYIFRSVAYWVSRVRHNTHTHARKNNLTFKQINCPRWPSSIHQEYRAMPNAYKYATIYGIKKYKFEDSRLFSTTNW